MSNAEITELHDTSNEPDTRIETLDTDWDSILSAVTDQAQVWAFALVTLSLAAFGFLYHTDWYGEVTFGLLTLTALVYGVRNIREELRRHRIDG